MIFIPLIFICVLVVVLGIKSYLSFGAIIGTIVASIAITGLIYFIDMTIQTSDSEVWSGYIEQVEHKEEYDEWHPPETHTSTDSKGRTTTTTTAGYYEHHEAENRIKTTDSGWLTVDYAPDGRRFDDGWVNTDSELSTLYRIGTPSASVHAYENRVQASDSIYKHKNIDLEQYKGLPEYPTKIENYIHIDRLVGTFPNEALAEVELNKINTALNRMVPDPEREGKMRSYKQVNLILVNVGADKSQDWGFALQDYWGNGNKNDFIVVMSLAPDGKVNWVYPFSWSEVELLKIEVRDYFLQKGNISDTLPVIKDIASLIEQKFVRKQFKDFEYISLEMSSASWIILWITHICGICVLAFNAVGQANQRRRRNSWHNPYVRRY
jgi:hypothetical protein